MALLSVHFLTIAFDLLKEIVANFGTTLKKMMNDLMMKTTD